MKGNENEIRTAEELRAMAIRNINDTISYYIDEEGLAADDRVIVNMETARDEITAFDGNAKRFIRRFEALTNPMDTDPYSIGNLVMGCYRAFHRDQLIMKN